MNGRSPAPRLWACTPTSPQIRLPGQSRSGRYLQGSAQLHGVWTVCDPKAEDRKHRWTLLREAHRGWLPPPSAQNWEAPPAPCKGKNGTAYCIQVKQITQEVGLSMNHQVSMNGESMVQLGTARFKSSFETGGKLKKLKQKIRSQFQFSMKGEAILFLRTTKSFFNHSL